MGQLLPNHSFYKMTCHLKSSSISSLNDFKVKYAMIKGTLNANSKTKKKCLNFSMYLS